MVVYSSCSPHFDGGLETQTVSCVSYQASEIFFELRGKKNLLRTSSSLSILREGPV